jgi:hypothetical protein
VNGLASVRFILSALELEELKPKFPKTVLQRLISPATKSGQGLQAGQETTACGPAKAMRLLELLHQQPTLSKKQVQSV